MRSAELTRLQNQTTVFCDQWLRNIAEQQGEASFIQKVKRGSW